MTESNLPRYLQIHNQLRQEIEDGKWRIGDKLPSERDLAICFKVSRMTLRQAVQTLADEGVLERKIGSGTYVAAKKVQESLKGTTSFTEIVRGQGKVPSSNAVSFFVTQPSASEMERLNLTANDKILKVERIRFANDVPICFEVMALPYEMVKNFNKTEVTNSFYETLQTKGNYKIGSSEQNISATLAKERTADFLNIKKGEAMLKLIQVTYLEDGRPFELVRSYYVGNRFEFFLERK